MAIDRIWRTLSTSLGILGSLTACTIGPDYHQVEPQVPRQWQAEHLSEASTKFISPAQLQTWWKQFGDATLDALITRALTENRDANIALARIEAARAERHGIRAGLFPAVNVSAGAQRQVNPLPGLVPGIRYNLFDTGFDAGWELDLFGRQRRRLEAANAGLEAAGEQYAETLVTLCAELARGYIEYRNLQDLLRITRSNLDTMRATLDLTGKRYREGIGTRHDVVRARAQTELTEAQIPALEANKIAALRQLEMLIGQTPGALANTLREPTPIPLAAGRALLASPADTLRHRPDVRAAERQLAAATAMQGAAIAELYPKIALSGFLGLRSADVDTLFTSAAFAYGPTLTIVQPLLNFGRIRAGIDLAKARQREAYLTYEKRVLDALRETETALTRYLMEAHRQQMLTRSAADQQDAVRLSRLRYREGVSSLLDVLDAQRALYAVESELSKAQAATAIHLVALYKSLGGGTMPIRPEAGTPP